MRKIVVIGLLVTLAACADKKAEQRKEQERLNQQHAQQVQSTCQSLGAPGTPQYTACSALYNQYSPTPQAPPVR